MLDPVGCRARVKGFDAQPFQTVPQLAGVLRGDDHQPDSDETGLPADLMAAEQPDVERDRPENSLHNDNTDDTTRGRK